jgi:hypothetical protein
MARTWVDVKPAPNQSTARRCEMQETIGRLGYCPPCTDTDRMPEPPKPKRTRFTRAQRAMAKKVANRMLTVERREFPSSSSEKVYTAVVHVDGKTMCDCPGWTIKRSDRPRLCKHTRAMIGPRPSEVKGEFVYVRMGA